MVESIKQNTPAYDAHCHFSMDPPSAREFDRFWHEDKTRGFFLGGISPEEWGEQLTIAKVHPRFRWFHSFGLHPWWVCAQLDESTLVNGLEYLEQMVSKAHAVGECGLDFGRTAYKNLKLLQETYFKKQVQIAAHLQKPLILHVVQAHGRVLEILSCSSIHAGGQNGLVHGFSGSYETAMEYIRLGFLISFGEASLKAVNGTHFRKLKDSMSRLPLNSITLETDSAMVEGSASKELGTKRLTIQDVAEAVASCRPESAEELILASNKNLLKGVCRGLTENRGFEIFHNEKG